MDAIQERLAKTEEKMKKSIAALDNEYKSIPCRPRNAGYSG